VSKTNEQELVFNLQCLQRRTARKRFRKDILDSWENLCAYCGSDRAHTLDHIIPRAKGGSTKRGNLLACCGACNLAKGAQEYLLWFRQQTFWTEEREQKIFKWLSQNHEASIIAQEYETLCSQLLKVSCLPPLMESD